ncbi:MAG: peroxiredoxin family protein [Candidatus Eisenbacteria bacterium]
MRTLWCGLLLVAFASVVFAQVEPKPASGPPTLPNAPRSAPGATLVISGHITAGEDAPSFELASSSGHDRSLHSLKGDWVVLVFMPRKSDFVPYKKAAADFAKLPATLLGITCDNPQTLRTLVTKEQLPYELLGDATGEVSAVYGMWDPLDSTTRAGLVVVDRKGMVRLVVSGQILPPEEVLSLTSITIQGS